MYSHLRHNWQAAVERSGLGTANVRELQRLRTRLLLLAEAEVNDRVMRRLLSSGEGGLEVVKDWRRREEAALLARLLPALALREDQAQRPLVRKVGG